MIGTIDDLKGKLDIPVTDESRNDALTLVMESASIRILEECNYEDADATDRVEIYEHVQVGNPLMLERRPITVTADVPQVAVAGRGLGEKDDAGAPSWTDLEFDVVDAERGKIVILGSDLGWWPPQDPRPKFKRWREPEWPIVRITYDVDGQGGVAADQDLIDATASLAAFWYKRDLAGASSEVTLGAIGEKYLDEPLPGWVMPRLRKHLRRSGRRARWF